MVAAVVPAGGALGLFSITGRIMWAPDNPNHSEMAANLQFLVESPTSPWRQIPWQPYPVPAA